MFLTAAPDVDYYHLTHATVFTEDKIIVVIYSALLACICMKENHFQYHIFYESNRLYTCSVWMCYC